MIALLLNTTSGNVTVLLKKPCRKDGLSPAVSEEALSNPMPGNSSTMGCTNSCFNVASKFSTLNTFERSLLKNLRHFGEMSSEKNPWRCCRCEIAFSVDETAGCQFC